MSNELQGEIPPEFEELTKLQTLWLSGNRLTRMFHNIYKLTNLISLRLSNNEIEGVLPPLGGINMGIFFDGGLRNLYELHLDYNRLSGVLGPDLGEMTSLGIFHANNNNFLGTIPKEIGRIPNLASLRLGDNDLSGPLHPDIAKPDLSLECNLSGNSFQCPLPTLVTAKRCLQSSECTGIFVGDF